MRMGQSSFHYGHHCLSQELGVSDLSGQRDNVEYDWESLGPKPFFNPRLFDHANDGTLPSPGSHDLSNMQRFLQYEQRAFFNPVPACYRAPFETKLHPFHDAEMHTGWSHKPIAPSVPSPYGSQVDHRLSIDQDSLSSCSVLSPRTNESYLDYDSASDRRISTPCDASRYTSEQQVHPGYSSKPSGGYTNTFSSIAPAETQLYPDAQADAEVSREDVSDDPRLQDGATNAPYYESGPTLAHRDFKYVGSLPEDEGIGSSINDDSAHSTCTDDDDMDIEIEDNKDEDTDYKPSKRTKSSSSRRTSRASTSNRSPTMSRRSSGGRFHPSKVTKSNPHPCSIIESPRRLSRPQSNITAPSHTSTELQTSSTAANRDKHRCNRCPQSYPSLSGLNKHVQSTHTRPFTCTFARYGCSSTFGSKNEWKRHVTSQHLRPGVWRCDIGNCVPKVSTAARRNRVRKSSFGDKIDTAADEGCWNEFNRKDLFTQHVRRMHGPPATASRAEKDKFEVSLEETRERCWRQLHPLPPRSSCGFCVHAGHVQQKAPPSVQHTSPTDGQEEKKAHVFEGKSAWEERMEHVGRHLEKQSMEEEEEDIGLREWMVSEGLVFWERGAWRVTGIAEGKKRGGRTVKTETDMGDGEEDAEGEDE
ncbi:hypothetical protein G7Y79_00036g072900 [Physcia stellaris]|nr:hypothetical protein G7Y79_00036g072900 [Physcia stellaris]